MKKRLISLLLAFSMMLTFLPAGAVSAFAEGAAEPIDPSKGTLLTGGETITGNGTYQLNGTYTQSITINTEDSVEINVTGNVTVKAPNDDRDFYFINIQKANSVIFNGDAQYPVTVNGGNAILNNGENLIVNGGKYICYGRDPDFYAFGLSNGRNLVENVTIESKYDAIHVTLYCDSAVIRNSNITASNSGIGYKGCIECRTTKGTLELDRVTVHALSGHALNLASGTITIKGGEYTSDGAGYVIHSYQENSDAENSDAIDLTITGGTYKSESQYAIAAFRCKGTKKSTIRISESKLIGNSQLLWFDGAGAETLTIDGDTTLQSTGGTADAVIVGHGQLIFNSGTIEVSGGSARAALRTYETGEAIVNDGTFKGAEYDIKERNETSRVSPCRVHLKNATFDDNVCNVYLGKDRQIDVAQNYTGEVMIECEDPKDGRQLTTATTGEYQKDLNLTSADKDYLVGYKTEDGKEYRCLSKKVGVTVSGLEDEIKAGDSAEFIVTLTHDGNTGKGILTFGDKNGEIEYLDDNGVYQPMPPAGREIDLESPKNNYTFRITPQETGKQTLTTVVKQGENELARHTTNFAGMPTLSVTGGNVTVEKGGQTLNIVPDVTGDKKTYSVPNGAKVTVTLDKTQIPEGMVFDMWTTGSFSLPSGQNYKAETVTFTMSESVDIAAQYRDATIEDDGSTVLGTAAMIGTAAVGAMVLGYQAYSLGTEFAGYLMDLPYFPDNRSALAVMLWEDAGKPMPESEQLYPDVGQEEQDMDLQHAARWAMENDLIPDRNEEGTAPEEMKFYPDNAVTRIDALNAWQKAQELKKNA